MVDVDFVFCFAISFCGVRFKFPVLVCALLTEHVCLKNYLNWTTFKEKKQKNSLKTLNLSSGRTLKAHRLLLESIGCVQFLVEFERLFVLP